MNCIYIFYISILRSINLYQYVCAYMQYAHQTKIWIRLSVMFYFSLNRIFKLVKWLDLINLLFPNICGWLRCISKTSWAKISVSVSYDAQWVELLYKGLDKQNFISYKNHPKYSLRNIFILTDLGTGML